MPEAPATKVGTQKRMVARIGENSHFNASDCISGMELNVPLLVAGTDEAVTPILQAMQQHHQQQLQAPASGVHMPFPVGPHSSGPHPTHHTMPHSTAPYLTS
jgi:hypothetical protein